MAINILMTYDFNSMNGRMPIRSVALCLCHQCCNIWSSVNISFLTFSFVKIFRPATLKYTAGRGLLSSAGLRSPWRPYVGLLCCGWWKTVKSWQKSRVQTYFLLNISWILRYKTQYRDHKKSWGESETSAIKCGLLKIMWQYIFSKI
jgi:hypothetical protein